MVSDGRSDGEGLRTLAVDVAQHGGRDVDREDVVGISEETDAGDHTDLHMEPAASVRQRDMQVVTREILTRIWPRRFRQGRRDASRRGRRHRWRGPPW